MAVATRRRGHGDDSIYFDASKNRWVGATSLGFSLTVGGASGEVRGRTRAEIREKLQALHRELDAGLQTSASYTVAACIQDWLQGGLTSRQPTTIENYQRLAAHAIARLGAVRLKNLTAKQCVRTEP